MIEISMAKGLIIMGAMVYLWMLAQSCRDAFKIGYYEAKLECEGFDIDHIKKMTFRQMIKGGVTPIGGRHGSKN